MRQECGYCQRRDATTTAPVVAYASVEAITGDAPPTRKTIPVCDDCVGAIASVRPGRGIGR